MSNLEDTDIIEEEGENMNDVEVEGKLVGEVAELKAICDKYGCKYTCPECKNSVPFFIKRSKKAPVVKCPVCGAVIKSNVVPKESIIVSARAYKLIGKASLEEIIDTALKEQEQGLQEEEEEEIVTTPPPTPQEKPKPGKGVITEGLFYQPKTPCEVLAEILDEFAFVNEEFKTFALRRCERRGFLHPIELLSLLQRMKSGIRTKEEAGIIAEEYAVALQRELERAQREGINYPYLANLSISEPIAMSDPYVQRLLQILPPSLIPEQLSGTQAQSAFLPREQRLQPSTYGMMPQYGYQSLQTQQLQSLQQQLSFNTTLVELFKAFSQSQQEQQKQQLELMKTNMQLQQQLVMQNIQQALEASFKPINETLRLLAEAIKELKSGKEENKIGEKILELVKESAEAKAQLKFYDKLLELQKEHAKQIDEITSKYEAKIEEILKSMPKIPSGEYKSDEAKLVAQALAEVAQIGHKFIDSIDRRQPIKIIVEALPMLTGTGKPIPKKYKEAETGTEIISELEKEGLVEE